MNTSVFEVNWSFSRCVFYFLHGTLALSMYINFAFYFPVDIHFSVSGGGGGGGSSIVHQMSAFQHPHLHRAVGYLQTYCNYGKFTA